MEMAHIKRESLLTLEAYHKARPEIRKQAIAERRIRTVHLGEHITVIFENELLMRYQIQEMLRVEKIFDAEVRSRRLANWRVCWHFWVPHFFFGLRVALDFSK